MGTLYNLLVYFFSCGYGAGSHICERLNLHACTFQLYILMEDYYLWRAHAWRSFSQSQLLDISWSRSFIINTRHQLAKPITYTSHSFKSRQAKLVILSIDARTSRCQAKHFLWIPSQILEGTQSRYTHSSSTWKHSKKLTPILFISEFCRALATIFGPSVMCFYLLVTSVTPSQFSLPLVKLVSWNVVQVVHWDLVWVEIECLCLPSGDLV